MTLKDDRGASFHAMGARAGHDDVSDGIPLIEKTAAVCQLDDIFSHRPLISRTSGNLADGMEMLPDELGLQVFYY